MNAFQRHLIQFNLKNRLIIIIYFGHCRSQILHIIHFLLLVYRCKRIAHVSLIKEVERSIKALEKRNKKLLYTIQKMYARLKYYLVKSWFGSIDYRYFDRLNS